MSDAETRSMRLAVVASAKNGITTISYNERTKIVQTQLLEELYAAYILAIETNNRTELENIGLLAARECLPPDIDFDDFNSIQVKDFCIEMIWIRGSPINSIIPIHRNSSVVNISQKIIVSTHSYSSSIFDGILFPKSLMSLKQSMKPNNFIQIDGHTDGDWLRVNESVSLIAEDLPVAAFIFLNGCDTERFLSRSGIYTVSKIKDSVSKIFASHLHNQLGRLSIAIAIQRTIYALWETYPQVLGYRLKGSATQTIFTQQNVRVSKFHASLTTSTRPDLQEFYSDEKLISWDGDTISRTELFARRYSMADVVVEHKDELYELPDVISPFRNEILEFRLAEHERRYNVRLSWWPGEIVNINNMIQGDKLVLTTQRLDFDDISVTNLSPEIFIESWHCTVREMFEPGPSLKEFNEATHPNQIGIGTLLITKDNYLILQERSNKTFVTHESQKGLTISAVGFLKFKKNYLMNGIPCPFKGVRAQLLEELGIPSDWIVENTMIGGSRSLENMGSLSLRFVTRIDRNLKEVKENWIQNPPADAWEYDKFFTVLLPGDRERTVERLKRLAEKYHIPASTAVTFHFFEKVYLEEN